MRHRDDARAIADDGLDGRDNFLIGRLSKRQFRDLQDQSFALRPLAHDRKVGIVAEICRDDFVSLLQGHAGKHGRNALHRVAREGDLVGAAAEIAGKRLPDCKRRTAFLQVAEGLVLVKFVGQ